MPDWLESSLCRRTYSTFRAHSILLLPSPAQLWAYGVDVQLLVRFFLAGFFSYLFARRFKIGSAGSVMSGLLYMFQAYFLAYGFTLRSKLRYRSPWSYMVTTGSLTQKISTVYGSAHCSLAGPSSQACLNQSFFSLFLGTLWYFYKVIFIKHHVGKDAFLRYGGATVLGIMMAAVFLLPLFEAIANSKSIITSIYFLQHH